MVVGVLRWEGLGCIGKVLLGPAMLAALNSTPILAIFFFLLSMHIIRSRLLYRPGPVLHSL